MLKDHLPVFLFNLSWESSEALAPLAELTGIDGLGTEASGQTGIASSNRVLLMPRERNITADQLEVTRKRIVECNAKEELKKACQYLARGRWLINISGGDEAIRAAALLAYFQAVEVAITKIAVAIQADHETQNAVDGVVN